MLLKVLLYILCFVCVCAAWRERTQMRARDHMHTCASSIEFRASLTEIQKNNRKPNQKEKEREKRDEKNTLEWKRDAERREENVGRFNFQLNS